MSTDSLSLHHHLRWGLGPLVSNGLLHRILETYQKFNNSPLVVGTRRSGFRAQQVFPWRKELETFGGTVTHFWIYVQQLSRSTTLPPPHYWPNEIRFHQDFRNFKSHLIPSKKKNGPKNWGGFPGGWFFADLFMAPLSEACTLHWNIELPEAEVGSNSGWVDLHTWPLMVQLFEIRRENQPPVEMVVKNSRK